MKFCFIGPLAVASIFGFFIGFTAARQTPVQQRSQVPIIPEKPLPSSSPSKALGRLLTQTPEEIDKGGDIASSNLACLAGLPGTGNVNLDQATRRLDHLAEMVQKDTERYMREIKPTKRYTKNYYKACFLVSMLQTIYRSEHQIQRDPNPGIPDTAIEFNDSGASHPEELFFHKGESGRPSRLHNAVLFVSIGRRLGYPLKLVETSTRLVARWESVDGKESFVINSYEIDLHQPITTNPFQMAAQTQSVAMPPATTLKSLSPSEELALFLRARGQILASLGYEAESRSAFASAYRFAPQNRENFQHLASSVDNDLSRLNLTWKDLEDANLDHFNLKLQQPKPKDALKTETKR